MHSRRADPVVADVTTGFNEVDVVDVVVASTVVVASEVVPSVEEVEEVVAALVDAAAVL